MTNVGSFLAETVGFEPTCRLITDKTISSRSRYDHFDTSPYFMSKIIIDCKVRFVKRINIKLFIEVLIFS